MSPSGPAGGAATGPEDRRRRRVLWSMPTGLYLVGSRAGDKANLMTANWVMQVATAPPLVAVSVEAGAVTRRLVAESGAFSVTILDRGQRGVVRSFVKPVGDVERDATGSIVAMAGIPVAEVGAGLPVGSGGIGWLACTVRREVELGSHVLFVGEVTAVGEGGDDGDGTGEPRAPLRMEDTRMHYGG